MQIKPKFISAPVVDKITPFHEYYIRCYSESRVNKAEFDVVGQFEKFVSFLALLSKNSDYFKDSKWHLHQFDLDKADAVNQPIFLDSHKEALQYISKYNRKNKIDNALMIPMVMDYSIRDLEPIQQHFFSSKNYFKDLNVMNFYDELTFKFVENYSGLKRSKTSPILESIMKSMAISADPNGFRFVGLFDNDFSGRRAPNDNEEEFYTDSYQVYPHRLKCVWKCVIKGDFDHKDIPQAGKVDNFQNGYTLVSSLKDGEYFSSYNADHIYRANEVELRLKELGVLPYSEII